MKIIPKTRSRRELTGCLVLVCLALGMTLLSRSGPKRSRSQRIVASSNSGPMTQETAPKDRRYFIVTVGVVLVASSFGIWVAAGFLGVRRALELALGIILILLLVWLVPIAQLWSVRNTLPLEDRIEKTNAARATAAAIIGGFALLLGLFATAGQLANTANQADVARAELATQRYQDAVADLTSSSLDLQLAGVALLGRMAQASEDDYWSAMQALAAHVKQHAAWPAPPATPIASGPTADVQAALVIIGDRAWTQDKNLLDLSNTDLRGVSLAGAHLGHTDLDGAHLEGATLPKTDFRGASVLGTQFTGAILLDSHMENLELSGADFTGAILLGAHLEGADLRGATGLTQGQIDRACVDGSTQLPLDPNGYPLHPNLTNLSHPPCTG